MSFLGTSLTPSGVVLPFAGTSAPSGWLLCDGSAISRTTYANLFAVLGTTYGLGDGSTTFNLPNTQGVFLRGAGSQTISAISYTGTLGTTQGDQTQGHKHETQVTGAAGGAGTFGGGASYPAITGGASIGGFVSALTNTPRTDGSNGTPRTGTQTHPANISVNHIIKI